MKIIFSISLIAASLLTSALMTLFVAGCVKAGQLQESAEIKKTAKYKVEEPHELGSSPTLEDIVRAAEGLEKNNQSN